MIVTHNLMAANAQRQYGMTIKDRAKSTEKLSSGYRINRAADDAAGLAISEKMRHLIRGLDRGSKNVEDGISLVQIADGALAEVHDMLHRMTELSVQAANDTNTNSDRSHIQREMTKLVDEIDRISITTEYNTMPVFRDKSAVRGSATSGDMTKLVGCDSADAGHLVESFQTSDGKYHPAAILDFSNVNEKNISKLYDKFFSFECSMSCSEQFKFTLFNGDGTQSSVDNLRSGARHRYMIDIGDCSTGEDIVNKLYSYVSSNKPSSKPEESLVDGVAVSHSNAMVKSGNKLIIYGYRTTSSEEAAKKIYNSKSGSSGAVDCSALTSEYFDPPENGFWIQCSDQQNDAINIQVEKFSAKSLGISPVDVSSFSSASNTLDKVEHANGEISRMRASLGAFQNRLEHTYNNDKNKEENTQAAESRLRDTDIAKQMSDLSKHNILSQVGEAMISQANSSRDGVLALLQ